MSDLTDADLFSLLFYGAVALWLALAIPRLFRGRVLAGFLALGFWVGAFCVAVTGYAYRYELNRVAERVVATLVPGTPIDTGAREVTVVRDGSGQFTVRGSVGAARLQFIFDTGASAVVLRAEDAARVGIRTRALTYDVDVSTANGHALTAETALPVLSIGAVTVRDVPVLVARPGALRENLLGMSFLNQLASFSVSDDRLVLRGR